MQASEIGQHLGSGERLLWSGRPQQGLRFQASDSYLIPFSVLWCGFAIFWESSVLLSKAPVFFQLWGIPFVLVGLYLVFGRFFMDAKIRAGTEYALTNERILILSGWRRRSTRSVLLRSLSEIDLKEEADGRGTIIVGPHDPRSARLSAGWPRVSGSGAPTLDSIENVKSVYELIRRAQRELA
jgi:hypothetical protein